MSNAAMRWAWEQELPPIPKLVLVSMGDSADERGVCWPSIPTLARKCSLSCRSVQRILRELEARGKVRRDSRFRKNGSQTSNGYILALEGGGDTVSGAPDTGDTHPRHPCQGPGDSTVTPRSLIEPSEKPQPPPPPPPPSQDSAAPDGPADRGGGEEDQCAEDDGNQDVGNSDLQADLKTEPSHDAAGVDEHKLVYPNSLSPAEREEAKRLQAGLSTELAQRILDELAGRLQAKAIHATPLGYLRGLVKRAHQGTFEPEMAMRVAEQRRQRQQTEVTLRQAEVRRKEALQQAADALSSAQTHPLARRIAAIGERTIQRRRKEG